MSERFTNNASSLLNGAINDVVTSLVVDDATTFPNSGDFRIVIDSEIMIVTGVSGTTFTVTRGAEGTTAAAHSDNAPITHILTSGSLKQILADYHLTGTFSSRPAAGTAGRIFFPTDCPWLTHCRDTGSIWENFWNGQKLEAPPTSSWSWHQQLTTTVTQEKDSILLYSPDVGTGTGHQDSTYYRSTPATPYKITMGFFGTATRGPVHNSNSVLGMNCIQSSTFSYHNMVNHEGGDHNYSVHNMNAGPSFVSSYTNTRVKYWSQIFFMAFEDDGTNKKFYMGDDPNNLQLMYTVTRTDFITVDSIGFFVRDRYHQQLRLIHYKVE